MSCRRSHPNAPEGASGASFKCWWHAVESRAGSRIEMDSELMGNGYCNGGIAVLQSCAIRTQQLEPSHTDLKLATNTSWTTWIAATFKSITWHRRTSQQAAPAGGNTWHMTSSRNCAMKTTSRSNGASVNSKHQRLMDGISAQVARNNYDRDSNR